MLESKVEEYFQQQIKLCGGLTMKFTSPSIRGVPDQIALYQGGTYFVELKAPNEKPRKSQTAVHEQFNDHGITVYTLDTKKSVDNFITNVLKTTVKEKEDISFEIKQNMFK